MMKLKFQIKHVLLLPVLCLILSLASCGGGGGGGGGSSGSAATTSDDDFYLEEAFFGRPLLDIDGFVSEVIAPASIIETDPITGLLDDGYPKSLYNQSLPVAKVKALPLASMKLGDSPTTPYLVKIIPRNGAIVLDFSKPVDEASLNLSDTNHLSATSPIQIVSESGDSIPAQVLVQVDKVVLNPVTEGNVGFPASPLSFDQDGVPISNPTGFLSIIVYSTGTGINVLSTDGGGYLTARSDLQGTPVNPIGFNPGNSVLDFIAYADFSFNGFLPDITPPRIIREVNHEGVVGALSNAASMTVVDDTASFNILANGGSGEWEDTLLLLKRPTGDPQDPYEILDGMKVLSNTANTLYLERWFNVPIYKEGDPGPNGPDEYELKRAEYYEPIKGFDDLATAIEPIIHPKDPQDPEDAKNSDLFNFVSFEEWNDVTESWDEVDYDPGTYGTTPVEPKYRVTLHFSEPMAVSSFKPYDSFYVCPSTVDITEPGFDEMKLGRVTGSDNNRAISFEPLLEDQTSGQVNGERLLGFGGQSKALRLVTRIIPPRKTLEGFYAAFGSNLPAGVIEDLDTMDETGVEGVISLGGRPLALPVQFFDPGSPYCVAYNTSSGHGAYPPTVDFKYEFTTIANGTDEETGVLAHRFMGLPYPAVGGTPVISGATYLDHPDEIYGPHMIDLAFGQGGVLSGHPVEYIEHVFDEENSPPVSSPYAPDPVKKIPFGVGTPINNSEGCRFQHVYRNGDCCPDVPIFQDTLLSLIGLSWSPIGGWVTNTTIEKMSIAITKSNKNPITLQGAGIPSQPNTGLVAGFNTNRYDPPGIEPASWTMVVGTPTDGVPYILDWRNLYAPQNANSGDKFFYYLPWPTFDKPKAQPGYKYDSAQSLLIEYRMDPNLNSSVSLSNGFAFHAGIISSVLPRFRIYHSGGTTNGVVSGCTRYTTYPTANGPLGNLGKYGDNSRYFMIFNYVKRRSTIESPILGIANVAPGDDIYFMNPLVEPPLSEIPDGTTLTLTFACMNADGSSTSPWFDLDEVEDQFNTSYGSRNYVRFRAVFDANLDSGIVPAIDSLVIPYRVIEGP